MHEVFVPSHKVPIRGGFVPFALADPGLKDHAVTFVSAKDVQRLIDLGGAAEWAHAQA
jgi:hypothetical protein